MESLKYVPEGIIIIPTSKLYRHSWKVREKAGDEMHEGWGGLCGRKWEGPDSGF